MYFYTKNGMKNHQVGDNEDSLSSSFTSQSLRDR